MLLDRELPEFNDDDWEDVKEIYMDTVEWNGWNGWKVDLYMDEEDEDDWEPESWDYIMYGPMDGIAREY